MMTREELIDNVLQAYIDHSDAEGQWDACSITEAVMELIVRDGGDRITKCPQCSTNYPWSMYDDCPYWDNHQCSGGCGETNENCTCENCDECGYYECECPHCIRCDCKRSECECPEEDAVFA